MKDNGITVGLYVDYDFGREKIFLNYGFCNREFNAFYQEAEQSHERELEQRMCLARFRAELPKTSHKSDIADSLFRI